jgi:hypothetical protein
MSTSIQNETTVIFGNGTFQVYLSREQLTITAMGNNESEALKIKASTNSQLDTMMRTMLVAMMRLDWNSEYSYESTYAYEDVIHNFPHITPQNVKAAFEALADVPNTEALIRNLKADLQSTQELLALAKKLYSDNQEDDNAPE